VETEAALRNMVAAAGVLRREAGLQRAA
jgi:hypothetical protein